VQKSISREKSCSPHLKISVSCTSQEYDNIATPSYPFFAPSTVKWSLTGGQKQKENSKLLDLKVVASKYGDLTWKRLVFWKTGR